MIKKLIEDFANWFVKNNYVIELVLRKIGKILDIVVVIVTILIFLGIVVLALTQLFTSMKAILFLLAFIVVGRGIWILVGWSTTKY